MLVTVTVIKEPKNALDEDTPYYLNTTLKDDEINYNFLQFRSVCVRYTCAEDLQKVFQNGHSLIKNVYPLIYI